MSIGLVIVFNHAYEANLPRLDALYAGRFSSVRHLMPFYRGSRPDVSPVFHSSYNFQGFFAEAFRSVVAPGCDHYLFIGDDLILQPDVNETTLPGLLGLDAATGYIKTLTPIGKTGHDWTHALAATRALKKNGFVEFDAQLPSRDTAMEHLRRAGRTAFDLPARELLPRLFHSWRRDRKTVFLENLLFALRHHRRGPSRLPLFASYSDLVSVPAAAMSTFCSICGVLAAVGMFVEVAIPTALALSCPRVRTEADISRRGREIWDAGECNALLAAHGFRLQPLLDAMSSDLLYIHPVKLSRLQP